MNLLEAILAFRRSRYFWVFYVLVLSLIVSALPFLGCLSIILIPVVMFALPYWLKEKRTRVLAVNGLVVVAIGGLILTGIFVQSIAGAEPVAVSASRAGIVLSGGIVSPPRGVPGDSFNFTVTLTVPAGGNPSDFIVYTNLTKVLSALDFQDTPSIVMLPVDPGDANLVDGKQYYAVVRAEDFLYGFWFTVESRAVTPAIWVGTPPQFGPLVTGFGPYFSYAAGTAYLALVIPALMYYLILMLFWWTRRARQERERLGMISPAETDTGFMCTNCGADVPGNAEKCPKCGAVFDEVREPAAPTAEQVKEEPSEGPDEKP